MKLFIFALLALIALAFADPIPVSQLGGIAGGSPLGLGGIAGGSPLGLGGISGSRPLGGIAGAATSVVAGLGGAIVGMNCYFIFNFYYIFQTCSK